MPSASPFARAALFALLLSTPLSAEESVYMSVEAAERPYIKALSPVGSQSLGRHDIETRAAQSTAGLLDADTAVSVKSGGAPGLAEVAGFNGFSGKNTAVLFNGKKAAPDLTGTFDLSSINPASVDSMGIYAGPVSPLYGANAQGGVIDIRTADPSGPDDVRASGSLDSFATEELSAVARGGIGPVRAAFSGGRRRSAGFQQNGDYSGADGSFSVKADAGAAGIFRVEGMRSYLNSGIPGGTPVPLEEWDGQKEREANSLADRQDAKRGLIAAGYSAPPASLVKFAADAWDSTYDLSAFQYGETTHIRTGLKAAKLSAGLDGFAALTAQYERNTLESETYGDHAYDVRSLGGEGRVTLMPELDAVFGARLESAGLWPEQFNPRLVIVWRPAAGWKLSASAGRAWQAPTFADMYNPWAPSNPDLRPEHSWQYSVGVQREIPGQVTAELTAFYADIRDKIALDASNSYAAYNLDSGRNAGFSPSLKFRNDYSRHRLAYSFVYSEGRQPGGQWQASAYNPVGRISYAGEFDLVDRLTLSLNARYSGQQYTGLGNTGLRLPPYTTADSSLTYNAGKCAVSFSVLNLTDAHYAENADAWYGYYPMPGRTFRLRLSIGLNG